MMKNFFQLIFERLRKPANVTTGVDMRKFEIMAEELKEAIKNADEKNQPGSSIPSGGSIGRWD